MSCFQLATTTPVTASAGATGGAAALARDGIAPQAAAAGSDTPLETAMKIALVVSERIDPYCIVECVDDAEDKEEGGRRKEEGDWLCHAAAAAEPKMCTPVVQVYIQVSG